MKIKMARKLIKIATAEQQGQGDSIKQCGPWTCCRQLWKRVMILQKHCNSRQLTLKKNLQLKTLFETLVNLFPHNTTQQN